MSTVRGTGTGDGGAMTLPGFALVVSMNHTQGDGHTYYSLYGMLSAAAEIPTFSTLVRNKSALITNWATFYRDVVLHHDPEGNAPCENRQSCTFRSWRSTASLPRSGITVDIWRHHIQTYNPTPFMSVNSPSKPSGLLSCISIRVHLSSVARWA